MLKNGIKEVELTDFEQFQNIAHEEDLSKPTQQKMLDYIIKLLEKNNCSTEGFPQKVRVGSRSNLD